MANHIIKVWSKMMKEQGIPRDSLITGYLPIDHCGSFSRSVVNEKAITSDEFFDMTFDHSPDQVDRLMELRNAIVKPLDLEVGIRFADTICEQNAQEVVFGIPNKHLTFHTSLWCEEKEPSKQTSTITTVVKFNNRLDRLCFFSIRPFRKVIIRSMLKRVAKRLE